MLQEPPIEQITRRIVEAFRPRRIVMFGSRARGTAGRDSDLDLMVEMETPLRPVQRMQAIQELQKSGMFQPGGKMGKVKGDTGKRLTSKERAELKKKREKELKKKKKGQGPKGGW